MVNEEGGGGEGREIGHARGLTSQGWT
jgi:hypothetical protein